MKRCPQCHFTFEDYEEHCDFDGSELTPFPESERKIEVPQPFYVRVLQSPLGMAVLAIVALVISGLVIGYFDAKNQQQVEAPKDLDKRPAEVSLIAPVQTRTTAQVRTKKATTQKPSKRLRPNNTQRLKFSAARSSFRKARRPRQAIAKASPIYRSPRTANSRSQARHIRGDEGHVMALEPAQRKNDSKITAILKKSGSILKKTVGFLKKPFDL